MSWRPPSATCKSPESSTWAQKFNGSLWAFESVAQAVFDSHCDTPQLFWIWLKWWTHAHSLNITYKFLNNEWVTKVFLKSVEGGDLRILKFIIDYCWSKNDMIKYATIKLLRPFFQRHRLTYAPHADERLRRAVSLLEPKHFDAKLITLLTLCFSDYPVNHPLSVEENTEFIWNCDAADYARAFLLGHFLIPTRWTIKSEDMHHFSMLKTMKEVCDSFGVDFEKKFPGLRKHNQQIISLLKLRDAEDPETVLDQSFVWVMKHLGKDCKMNFFLYVHSRWPHNMHQWTEKISFEDMLYFAWRNPGFLQFLQLPDQMPSIFQLILSNESFGFEKGLYLERVIAKYGYDAIQQAMEEKVKDYDWRAFFVVGTIACKDVPIRWDLVGKCLPKNMDDIIEWINTLLRITGASTLNLPEVVHEFLSQPGHNLPLNVVQLLRFLFPQLDSNMN